MIILHDPKCAEYQAAGHPESPVRVRRSADYLRKLHPDWEWRLPEAATEEAILRAHCPEHLARLREPRDFDVDTPYHPGIDERARLSAGAAVQSMRVAREGRPSFCLMRPPGHHAERNRVMGFCYLNSVAIAALQAQAEGVGRVAIFDFDVHHGNGTEQIMLGRDDIFFASVHQFPAYPGTGTESRQNVWNSCVPPGADRRVHMTKLADAWQKVVDFKPEVIVVSAGFDAYRGDPLAQENLEAEDFATIGTWLRAFGRCGIVLEGGYSRELPELIDAFLAGITNDKAE
jgi:acetoin utilization deacetylase AcuC-like enzyme